MKYINGEYINGADLYGTQLQNRKQLVKAYISIQRGPTGI